MTVSSNVSVKVPFCKFRVKFRSLGGVVSLRHSDTSREFWLQTNSTGFPDMSYTCAENSSGATGTNSSPLARPLLSPLSMCPEPLAEEYISSSDSNSATPGFNKYSLVTIGLGIREMYVSVVVHVPRYTSRFTSFKSSVESVKYATVLSLGSR